MSEPRTTLAEVGAIWERSRQARDASSCFLTVVTRTQGRRVGLLTETLTSLAEQSDRDFEVVVLRHRTMPEQSAAVAAVVAGLPDWLRDRLRVLDVERPGRSSPLNDGFEAARGRYVAILDDDDLALPGWVEAFKALESGHEGQVLRTVAIRQPVTSEPGPDGPSAVNAGPADRLWPPTFEFVDHLLVNSTPPVAVAFPIEVFRDHAERFDESLETTEDWDFLMRAAGLVGVASSPEETCVYRWWVEAEGSRAEHDQSQWTRNEVAVRRKLDDRVLLLPRGSVSRLHTVVDERDRRIEQLVAERDREAANAQQLLGEAQGYLARLDAAELELDKRLRLIRKLRGKLAAQDPEPSEPAPKTGRWRKPRS